MNILFDYGAQRELADAMETVMSDPAKREAYLAADGAEQTATISRHLYTGVDPTDADKKRPLPEPDVILRTGGEQRSSNFLAFQSQYSEWLYDNRFWPQFDTSAFLEKVLEFQQRKPNYGK